jgi:aflatoxin B1 aldehyde reductase
VTFAAPGSDSLARTRFSGESTQQYFLNTFDKPEAHDALKMLNTTCQEHGVSLSEVCLRWLMYHSALGEEDAIILGAKRLDQLEMNVLACRKGPLPQALVSAVDKMSEGGLMHEGVW